MEIVEVIKQKENVKEFIKEKLVQPLESKINPYNIWKDLKTIIGKTFLEIETNNLSTKETQKEEEPINSLGTTIVNTTNKVKSITFPPTIKHNCFCVCISNCCSFRVKANLIILYCYTSL